MPALLPWPLVAICPQAAPTGFTMSELAPIAVSVPPSAFAVVGVVLLAAAELSSLPQAAANNVQTASSAAMVIQVFLITSCSSRGACRGSGTGERRQERFGAAGAEDWRRSDRVIRTRR